MTCVGIVMLRRISNSEVGTWLTCRRKYFYAFDMGIAPKKSFNNPSSKVTTLAVGTLGHQVLGIYYEGLMNGQGENMSRQAARDFLSLLMVEPKDYSREVVTATSIILERYWSHYVEKD